MKNDKLKILFVNYGPYSGCSGVHIHFLANTLVELGHECHVFLPKTDGAQTYFGEAKYPIYAFREIFNVPIEIFQNALIHVWTTREAARIPILMMRERCKIPYFVHLEDNEIVIIEKEIGVPTLEKQKEFAKKHPEKFGKPYWVTHPLRFEPLMRASCGVTCIMKSLEDFVPQDVPRMTFWPACEEEFFKIPLMRDNAIREACNIAPETFVLVYPGTIHSFNIGYFVELLRAVEQLHNEGFSLKILRSGLEGSSYDSEGLELYEKFVIPMENLSAHQLPSLMILADILVQPGAPGSFDDYRFPSKIPYFLASGRPVILPDTNVAEKLQHGRNCFLMKTGDAAEIAKYLKMLMSHPELAQSMGMHGRAAARSLFSWTKAAQSLIPFYEQALVGR